MSKRIVRVMPPRPGALCDGIQHSGPENHHACHAKAEFLFVLDVEGENGTTRYPMMNTCEMCSGVFENGEEV